MRTSNFAKPRLKRGWGSEHSSSQVGCRTLSTLLSLASVERVPAVLLQNSYMITLECEVTR